uniref:Uncharacterized protein n=1 Tax=Calcidiscus leptoporus TaxID=127549 RepID=A0A7S0J0H5_9EUKA
MASVFLCHQWIVLVLVLVLHVGHAVSCCTRVFVKLHARAAAPARSLTPHLTAPRELRDTFPDETQTPVEVVEHQLEALRQGNVRVFWRFVSPESKRETGTLRGGRYKYLRPPDFHSLPRFQPLLYSLDYKVVGALSIDERRCRFRCRVRVWPAGGERECSGGAIPSPPVEYIWRLTLQPLERPVCYDDDPMQQGISTGPPFAGCWLSDSVELDGRWGGGSDDGDEPPNPPDGGGGLGLRILLQV